MVSRGFKFGMLLQIAVGPICLFVFQTAVSHGFPAAMAGVTGVTLIDALFILAAIQGLGTLLQRSNRIKKALQTIGAFILIVFGISIITGTFGLSILPSVTFLSLHTVTHPFFKALLLTLSNPLTILFWAGVFSTKMIEDELRLGDMYLFGFGAVLSTVFFLSMVAAIGHSVNAVLPVLLLTGLNVFIGLVLIFLGIRAFRNASNKKWPVGCDPAETVYPRER
ncbi:LysE family transporter [Anoxynatronum sibiricum]|uniref:LysE family transporter n=2 Tax=Anoxynatronum sibiricum TaxID=210623 RepID=A0ABU9VT06_9CLOT